MVGEGGGLGHGMVGEGGGLGHGMVGERGGLGKCLYFVAPSLKHPTGKI